jgi:homoaconitase/3-isopropylmalate dehydratase large subunit
MNKYSSHVTQPRSQGASQAMLYGIGLTDADLVMTGTTLIIPVAGSTPVAVAATTKAAVTAIFTVIESAK